MLASFGGAGGQHAGAVAAALGMGKIFIHRFGGILSAYGMGMADVIDEQQEPESTIYSPETRSRYEKRFQKLEHKAAGNLKSQGFTDESILFQRYLQLRYAGTDTGLMISEPEDQHYDKAFCRAHLREFGFILSARDILVDTIRVRALGRTAHLKPITLTEKKETAEPATTTDCYFANGWQKTPVYKLADLGPSETVAGPAIIIQDTSTILVEPDCVAEITGGGDIVITLHTNGEQPVPAGEDPAQLAIFGNLFMSIAEQMGRTLQRTAISTNIKERCDFSCAVFDQNGGLVANAPHQPVHLGAMSETVRRQIEIQGDSLAAGDVLISNHPAAGGSHLPDITVITPVFEAGRPVFFVAGRGHHADIGSITPGSMPPFSKELSEEGACIQSFKLVENGVFQEQGVSELLTTPNAADLHHSGASTCGARCPADNISDLKAQVAANNKGIELLRDMTGKYGLETVQDYMQFLQKNAEYAVRDMLRDMGAKLETDEVVAEEYLDDGAPIRLRMRIDPEKGEAVLDFSGTGPEVWGNWNAPEAVTGSAVIYSLRCLVRQDIPLNQGCLNPVKIIIAPGTILSPSPQAAVVGGNVLTSQRIVDVILKALGAAAASQGCMNTRTFGDATFGYYETIGGGAGAGPGWHGRSGVHTHMTNTRITDPEILEKRYPVLLRAFSLRPGSGGRGQYQGGDGIIRELEFLKPLDVSILSERRVFAPYGLKGGKPGARGENLFIFQNGRTVNLGGKNTIRAQPGDRIRIQTPGGGGYGMPEKGKRDATVQS